MERACAHDRLLGQRALCDEKGAPTMHFCTHCTLHRQGSTESITSVSQSQYHYALSVVEYQFHLSKTELLSYQLLQHAAQPSSSCGLEISGISMLLLRSERSISVSAFWRGIIWPFLHLECVLGHDQLGHDVTTTPHTLTIRESTR